MEWMEQSNFPRPVRKAELQIRYGTGQGFGRPLLLPLFDPVLIHLAPDGTMVLQGIELGTVDGRTVELVQLWHCAPYKDGEAFPPHVTAGPLLPVDEKKPG